MPGKETIKELKTKIARLEETLERRTWELTNEITAFVVLQDELVKQSKSLNLRIREQACILQLSRLGQRIDLALEGFILEALPIIQASFRYPEIVSITVDYRGKSYFSPNHVLSPRKITRGLMENNKMIGSVNVFLAGDKDDNTSEDFLPEEKSLLITIANYITQIIRQKEYEDQLQNFRELITHSNNIIIISDETGKAEYVNEMYTRTLGFTLDELRSASDIYGGMDAAGKAKFREIRREVALKGIWNGEIRASTKSGLQTWLRGTVSAIKKENSKIKIVSIFDNVTEEITLRQELQEQYEKYKKLLENLPVSIILTDRNGRFQFLNRQALFSINRKEEEIIGLTVLDVFGEEGLAALKAIKSIFRTKKPVFVEVSYTIDNQLKHFDINRVPLFDAAGKVSSVMSIATETTEKKNAESIMSVQYSIDSLHSVSDSFGETLTILFDNLFMLEWVDAGGIYVYNEDKSMLELVYHRGLSEEFISGTSTYTPDSDEMKLVTAKTPVFLEFRDFQQITLGRLAKEGITFLSVLPLVYKDEVIGSLNLASRNVKAMKEYDQMTTVAIAAKVANLIALVKTSDALQRSNEDLREKIREAGEKQRMLEQKSKMELLGEMAAGLAHEVNQPLSIISLTLENIIYKMMENYVISDFLMKKFDNINQNITKIRELVDHIRAFSRDQSTVFFDRVDVNMTIRNVVSLMEVQMSNHHIRLSLDLCGEDPCTFGNATKLEQVIMNLLTNSRDAVETRAQQKTSQKYQKQIRVSSHVENNSVFVVVEDNGTGIRDEHKNNIFLPFFTTKPVGQGTGLGLAIIFGIVTEMKGTIDVESEWGKYTRMKLSLIKI